MVATTPRISVIDTVSLYVPAGVLDAARTIPESSMLMPVVDPVIAKVRAPVPPAMVNAVEESARETVVVMFEPPLILRGPLTVIVIGAREIALTESVTMMVS